jgi:hypothetical protein
MRTTIKGAFVALALTAACAPLGLHAPGTDAEPETLTVTFEDSAVTLTPAQVARGKVVLDVENKGSLEHSVRVDGPGLGDRDAEFVSPGHHRRIPLRLEPGTYRVSCPDGDHAERGLSAKLVVTD